MTTLSIPLPEYTAETPDDLEPVGALADAALAKAFPGRRLALRGLSLVDHPTLTEAELIDTIARLGHDRYDPDRRSVLHDFYAPYGIELHALPADARDGRLISPHVAAGSVVGDLLSDFRHGPPADRGAPPMRVDLLLVYDRDALEPIPVDYGDGPGDDPCEFRFRDPDRKPDALLAVVRLVNGASGEEASLGAANVRL